MNFALLLIAVAVLASVTVGGVLMILGVRTDGVSFGVDAAHQFGKFRRHAADDEERRLDAFMREFVQHDVGSIWQRSVVEREDDLVIFERQRLEVHHLSNGGECLWIEGDGTAGAKRIRIARAAGGIRRVRRCCCQNEKCEEGDCDRNEAG